MTEFVIVIAMAAALASGVPASPEGAVSLPSSRSAVGFSVYPTGMACEATAARLTAPPGYRFVCLPVDVPPTGLPDAY
jgi:hypothetical protein